MSNKSYTSSFAAIYDDIMSAVPYKLWFDYIREILDYYHKKPEKVLDLACGTGNMTKLFANNDYEVTGLDRSCDMLEVASDKVKSASFIQSSLTDFEFEESFDLVFCVFDSINYLLSAADMISAFENVNNVLKKDGIFIFDMNTINRLISIEPGTTVFNGEGYSCLWEDITDIKNKIWQVKLKIFFENKGKTYEEFHQETSYPVEEVEFFLKETGFEYVDVFKAYTFKEGTDNNNRLYFTAFKEKPDENTQADLKSWYKTAKMWCKFNFTK